MKVSSIKHSITYLFLALFLTMKMAGIHALSHADDKEHALHCVICDHAITHNLTPALTPNLQDYTIENNEPVVQKEITKQYSFVTTKTIASNQLFSRPPPSLL